MRRLTATAYALRLLAGLVVYILCTAPCLAMELDDSNLFVEAFDAFQKKDYLQTIDKVGQLNQIFPDSSLMDISLLLLARAGLNSGDNELAAKTINRFIAEFADSPLKTTVEEELLTMGTLLGKGEKLPSNLELRAAARKVRNDQIALERAAALKAEQERLAREKAEQGRIASAKAEAERKERERLAAEKAAKEGIKLAMALSGDSQQIEVGKEGRIPFELVNMSGKREEFLLSAPVAKEYDAVLTSADRPEVPVERVALVPGEKFNGSITYRMPFDRVDSFKAYFQLKAVSATYSDVSFSKETLITVSAPLVRAVSKPLKAKVSRGETVNYRVTVLNAGSVPAQGLTIRVVIPDQLDFIDNARTDYRQELVGTMVFSVAALETGRLTEFNINTKVGENAAENQELRLQVEIINDHLKRKDIFISSPAVVQGK